MKRWLRRIRGAVGMGLIWGVGWALVGLLIELITELVPGWDGALIDIWPAALAYPGFIGGVVFSAVLGIAGRRRRLDEMSLPRFAAWGALGGLLVGGFIATMGSVAGFPVWGLVIGSTVTLSCAGSAAGSLALARRAEDRESLNRSGERVEVAVTGGKVRGLLKEGG